jgi:hypothetical protein
MEELATLPTVDIVQTLSPLIAFSMPQLNCVSPGSVLGSIVLARSLAVKGKLYYDWMKGNKEATGMSFALTIPLTSVTPESLAQIFDVECPLWNKEIY